jgi:RNase adaptor protein for sRNA GlmZ degradation
MPTIIVEGVVAAGKTTLVRALEDTDYWRSHQTHLAISEHFTERALELVSPSPADRVRLLEANVDAIEPLYRLWTTYRFRQNSDVEPLVIFDRFHLTHSAQVGFDHFPGVESRLAQLNPLIVFLEHPLETLLPRVLATKNERNLAWKMWLNSLGSEQQVNAYFTGLQDRMADAFERSALPKVKLEAQSLPLPGIGGQIVVRWDS